MLFVIIKFFQSKICAFRINRCFNKLDIGIRIFVEKIISYDIKIPRIAYVPSQFVNPQRQHPAAHKQSTNELPILPFQFHLISFYHFRHRSKTFSVLKGNSKVLISLLH